MKTRQEVTRRDRRNIKTNTISKCLRMFEKDLRDSYIDHRLTMIIKEKMYA